jgi:hypothetical protein
MRHVPQCGPSILNGTSLAKFHWLGDPTSGSSAPPEKVKLEWKGRIRLGRCLSSDPGVMRWHLEARQRARQQPDSGTISSLACWLGDRATPPTAWRGRTRTPTVVVIPGGRSPGSEAMNDPWRRPASLMRSRRGLSTKVLLGALAGALAGAAAVAIWGGSSHQEALLH